MPYDIEHALVDAMSARVDTLGRPRVDLRRIRRRTQIRRYGVPVSALAVLALLVPLAAAQLAPARDAVADETVPVAPTTSESSERPAPQVAEPTATPVPPNPSPSTTTSVVPPSTTPGPGCPTTTRPLGTAERAALVAGIPAVVDAAEATTNAALPDGGSIRLILAPADVELLVPLAGTPVTDCGDAAVADDVRRGVEGMLEVLRQALFTGPGAGVFAGRDVDVAVRVISSTADRLVVRIAAGPPVDSAVTATLSRPDGAVLAVDTSELRTAPG